MGEGKMISTKSLPILLTIFSIVILSPDFSDATIHTQGYDFGDVELGSTQTTLVSISNLDNLTVVLTGVTFARDGCSDFSVVKLPESMAIPPNESVNFEIGYSPSYIGECSATLRIYNGSPMPSNEVTFTGAGVEQKPEPPEPENISQLLLEKLQKIIDYTNESYTYQAFRSYEQDKLSERRLKAFKKMLVVSYHLIENGHFEAAHNKLREICKKVDGKPKSNDFVPSDNAAHLALMIHDLIASFDFQYKQVKKSKKI
jgi:hypothetical protein